MPTIYQHKFILLSIDFMRSNFSLFLATTACSIIIEINWITFSTSCSIKYYFYYYCNQHSLKWKKILCSYFSIPTSLSVQRFLFCFLIKYFLPITFYLRLSFVFFMLAIAMHPRTITTIITKMIRAETFMTDILLTMSILSK